MHEDDDDYSVVDGMTDTEDEDGKHRLDGESDENPDKEDELVSSCMLDVCMHASSSDEDLPGEVRRSRVSAGLTRRHMGVSATWQESSLRSS